MDKKKCAVCCVLLPLDSFYKSKKSWTRKSGEVVTRYYYSPECKICCIERVKEYNRNHKEDVARAGKKFRAKTPPTANKGLLRRAEREASLPNDGVTAKEVFARDHGVCYACGTVTGYYEGEMDHLIGYALASCPGNIRENVAWMCKGCNRKKPKKYLFEPAVILYTFQCLIKEA